MHFYIFMLPLFGSSASSLDSKCPKLCVIWVQVLVALVIVAWGHVIGAGHFASLRFLPAVPAGS